MRIISDERDYYDSVQAYGQDQSAVFLRKEEELVVDRALAIQLQLEQLLEEAYIKYSYYSINGRNFEDYRMYYIGFCGKIYPVFRLETPRSCRKNYIEDKDVVWAYTAQDISNFLQQFKKLKKD